MLSFSVKPHVLKAPIKSLLGFCDLVIGDKVLIEGFKVFKTKDGNLFVKAPSRKGTVRDENGQDVEKWFPTTRFIDQKDNEKDWNTPFEKEVHGVMLDQFRVAMQASGQQSSDNNTVASAADGGSPKKNPLW